MISADRRLNRALGRAVADLLAAQPSSATGTRARRCAVREDRMWQASNRIEIRGLRALARGHRKTYRRYLARANANQRRALEYVKCRKRAFAALGAG